MTLDDQLLNAHAADDKEALVQLYMQAANQTTQSEARFFYLTQAYIFALDCGAPQTVKLAQQLKSANRL